MRTRQPITLLVLLLGPLFVSGCTSTHTPRPDHVPAGYRLVYQQSFETVDAIDDFDFTDSNAWRHGRSDDGNGYLELFQQSKYEPKHRSPFNIAILRGALVGSFVLDVDLKQVGREYGHRDLCVFFGIKDPEHFYYTHLATKGDQNAHQIFIVNDAPRTPVTKDRTEGVNWGDNVWRHVRVVRDAQKGTIAIYFEDMENPAQIASDQTFNLGRVGFGSFDDVGQVDNIQLWAPRNVLEEVVSRDGSLIW